LLKELTEAAAQIDVNNTAFSQGDIIFGGDAQKWKKFANSLKMRVAIRLKNFRGTESLNGKTWLQHIDDAIASGVFESNDDNAVFTYLSDDLNAAPYYRAYVVSARKDFALSRQFTNLLNGVNADTTGANNRDNSNPFFGLSDPRLQIFGDPIADGSYIGMPYGLSDAEAKAFGLTGASWPSALIRSATFGEVLMDYAEVCFILSERNSYDDVWYKKGIEASMLYWGVDQTTVNTYLGAVPAANAENVHTQKWIALFKQSHQPWIEYRRTGFPKTVVRPGEITLRKGPGSYVLFTPDRDAGTDLPRRMWFPTQEYTVNKKNIDAAVARMGGLDNLTTKVWWEGGN